MLNRMEALKIRDVVYALCREIFLDKLSDCYLYGSYARNDYDKESDIDIMIIVDMSNIEISSYRKQISHVAYKLSLKYDITISIKLQSKEILNKYKDVLPFYQNVLNEGVRYEGWGKEIII